MDTVCNIVRTRMLIYTSGTSHRNFNDSLLIIRVFELLIQILGMISTGGRLLLCFPHFLKFRWKGLLFLSSIGLLRAKPLMLVCILRILERKSVFSVFGFIL